MEPIIFKRWPDGQIIALFPEQDEKHDCCLSYMHHGQHAPASRALIDELPDATPEQAESLRRELARIGYLV